MKPATSPPPPHNPTTTLVGDNMGFHVHPSSQNNIQKYISVFLEVHAQPPLDPVRSDIAISRLHSVPGIGMTVLGSLRSIRSADRQ